MLMSCDLLNSKKFTFEIVTNFRTRDATVLVVALLKTSNLLKAGYPMNSLSLGILEVIYSNFLNFLRKKNYVCP